ncbi:MAG: uroporphyrinogen-III C-methyltransferase [Gammaproteobacteria bacterium]
MTDVNEDKQSKDNADKKALQETAKDPADAEQTADVKPEKQPGSGRGFLIILLLLVAAAAAALAVYNYKNMEEFNSLLTASSSAETSMKGVVSDLEQQMEKTRESYATISSKLDALEAQQESLRELIPDPVTETIELNEEFALAEIEHLLTIANYRLQLNHDVSTALKAMETADLRLQRLNVPGVLQVREQLIADMNSLRSLNQADLSGLGLFLSDLINRVDSLPVKEDVIVTSPEFEEVQPDATAENKAKEFFRLIWAELKSLVIISRDQDISKTMLLPDEIYFLRSNIKLELANARFAVFNRDTENFNASIEHLQDWLQNYFDKSDASVRNISESLQRMSRMNLAFPKIDISSSIESVKALAHRLSQQQEEVQE